MKDEYSNGSKVKKGIIIVFCSLLAIYLGISAYFMNHFYFGTTINNIDVAGNTVEQATSKIEDEVKKYTLSINGRENLKDEIAGKDINLEFNPQGRIEELKSKQKALTWIASVFNKSDTQLTEIVKLDDELLKDEISKLDFITNGNVIEPKNPKFQYTDNGYEIIDEVKGTKIDDELLYENVSNAILDGKTTLDIDEVNCYENPKYTAESSEIIAAKEELNKYTNVKITYDFGDRSEEVDGSKIREWLDVDENLNVELNEAKVRHYVEGLARTYNTYEITRDFKTNSGSNIKVVGGNYGWIINKTEETKALIEAINNGQDITREPVYSQDAVSRTKDDVGNTYVEINLTQQHLWYYKNGNLIVDGPVVTGNASLNYDTPSGTYRLNYKEKNAKLKGENYLSEVTYWMPFNNNIGIHDASWRNGEFGGQIYLTNGSHGCVNAPFGLAEKVFQNIEKGTPIVCY